MKYKTITIKVNAEFGSSFQAKTAIQALNLMLKAWSEFYRATHKKNLIDWSFREKSNRED